MVWLLHTEAKIFQFRTAHFLSITLSPCLSASERVCECDSLNARRMFLWRMAQALQLCIAQTGVSWRHIRWLLSTEKLLLDRLCGNTGSVSTLYHRKCCSYGCLCRMKLAINVQSMSKFLYWTLSRFLSVSDGRRHAICRRAIGNVDYKRRLLTITEWRCRCDCADKE